MCILPTIGRFATDSGMAVGSNGLGVSNPGCRRRRKWFLSFEETLNLQNFKSPEFYHDFPVVHPKALAT